MAVQKAKVIQTLLSLYAELRYLEVGVSQGRTFHSVQAASKVAVDPRFRFDVAEARATRPEATYHEVPSDAYFGRIIDPGDRFDVVYLDGLHTFEQTLRDFTNAIRFTSDRSVIVIDDVVPSSYLASLSDLSQFQSLHRKKKTQNDAWMGDVYRIVYFLDTFLQQYTYRTVADNLGQLIVWPSRREACRQRSVEGTARIPYEDILLNPEVFRYLDFAGILDEIRAWLAGNPARATPQQ